MAYKVLLVDDSPEIFNEITEHNDSHKLYYDIKHIKSGKELNEFLMTSPVDIILMAWVFKDGIDGLSLIKNIKFNTATSNIPIILCTRKDSIEDQVQALNQGADDFFKKCDPLDLLFSKMNAILRKIDKHKNNQINLLRKFHFIEDSLEVEHLGQRHKLSKKEYTIFKTLVENPGKVFSQDDLNKLTSGEEVFVSKRCIDTFITLLRKKIGKECIVSIRKKGYKLNDAVIESCSE